ncbi:MAG: GntR family transcriptional regulator [Cyanobacteria bacterium SIG30]|nr:GntR family transcriptional regulator [Cyanobacteria bacterium SIG30]
MPRKILINELSEYVFNFKDNTSTLSKDKVVLNMLLSWLKENLNKKIFHGDIMPPKAEIAKLFSVSVGTVQTAIRQAEDMGYFESKQCVGTMVRDKNNQTAPIKKMSSKTEVAKLRIKKIIAKSEIKAVLDGVKYLSEKIGTSKNTTRYALEALVREGYLTRKISRKNDVLYIVLKNDFKEEELQNVTHRTLYQKLVADIKKYITLNFEVGQKIIKNEEFAKIFNVSIRTINDAMKILNKEGIVLSRRGQYGTIYISEPSIAQLKKDKTDKNMFMTTSRSVKQDNVLYNWQKALSELKKYISKNFEAGDKLPSMIKLAEILNFSTNTVRKAVEVLAGEGVLYTLRGKYGGTFVNDMPEDDKESYSWLALNPDYFS